jgi:predicted dehydrogenase
MARVAVIGAGYWGPNLIRNLTSQRSCSELTVCDLNPKRLEWVKERYPTAKLTGNFDDVLASNVDGVLIATSVDSHFRLATAALKAGKHVFVEKPLSASVEQAEQMIAASKQAGKTLMVGHTFEYSPPVIKVRDLIKRGELGNLFFVSSTRVNLGIHRKDVSVVWDLAPHDFSILFNWIDARPTKITCVGKDYVQKGLCDVAFISVEFANGVIANLEVSWLAPSKLRRTAVVGSKKMVVYDDTEVAEKVKIYDRGVDFKDPETFGEFQLSYRTGDILSPNLDSFEPLALEMTEFLRAIDEGTPVRTDGESGLRVVEALTAAQSSLEQGGKPVPLASR